MFGPFDNFNLEIGHVLPALIHKAYLAKSKLLLIDSFNAYLLESNEKFVQSNIEKQRFVIYNYHREVRLLRVLPFIWNSCLSILPSINTINLRLLTKCPLSPSNLFDAARLFMQSTSCSSKQFSIGGPQRLHLSCLSFLLED